jgi:hypothetical protein
MVAGKVAFVSGAAIAETVGKKHGAKLGDLQVTQSRWANNRRRRRQVDIMSLIGTTIYRDHHQMNTRGEVLFGLTCRFIWTRLRGPRPSALIALDLAAQMRASFV